MVIQRSAVVIDVLLGLLVLIGVLLFPLQLICSGERRLAPVPAGAVAALLCWRRRLISGDGSLLSLRDPSSPLLRVLLVHHRTESSERL